MVLRCKRISNPKQIYKLYHSFHIITRNSPLENKLCYRQQMLFIAELTKFIGLLCINQYNSIRTVLANYGKVSVIHF